MHISFFHHASFLGRSSVDIVIDPFHWIHCKASCHLSLRVALPHNLQHIHRVLYQWHDFISSICYSHLPISTSLHFAISYSSGMGRTDCIAFFWIAKKILPNHSLYPATTHHRARLCNITSTTSPAAAHLRLNIVFWVRMLISSIYS